MKFLIKASYSAEGAKGVLSHGGGIARKHATEKMITGLGGKLESYYYVADCDAYVTCELPNMTAAASIALTIKASGMGSVNVFPLLTAEELEHGVINQVNYPLPGTAV